MPRVQTLYTVQEIQQLYEQGDAAHDFDHVLRVTRLADLLAHAEGADRQVVEAAALLHDVPVPHQERQAHHLAAAAFAQAFLSERGMPEKQVENVVHAIQAHRYRDPSIQPRTLEAKCLYDADKLDAMGAMGVGRAFAYAGARGHRLWTQPVHKVPPDNQQPDGVDYTPVHEFVYKLARLAETLHTETARAIGQERHAFMEQFFHQLDMEMLWADE